MLLISKKLKIVYKINLLNFDKKNSMYVYIKFLIKVNQMFFK